MNAQDRAIDFIRETRWDTLPAKVQHKARLCLLDVLGATLSGTVTRISQITANYAAAAWPGKEATILCTGRKASAAGAAFANGNAANALDIDDGAKYTKGHPGAQLFPATLALCEKLGLGGDELLTAMVIGYEVAHRAGRCWHDHHDIYQACGSWGSMATAAAASHLLRLNHEQVWHALGIAEYYAPNLPMMRDIDHPAMVKHGIGWGAMTGITAAELACNGFTGIPSLFSFEKYQDWVADIGDDYIMLDGVTFKEIAACSWSHAAIYGAKKIQEATPFEVEDIQGIHVDAYHETLRLGTRLPRTTEEAQFNTSWPLASYLVYGEVSPRQTLEKHLDDPKVIDLAQRIELEECAELNQRYQWLTVGDPRGSWDANVVITLRDGRRLESGVVTRGRDGSHESDPHWFEEKFYWLLRDIMPDAQIQSLVDMVLSFESVSEVAALVELARREVILV